MQIKDLQLKRALRCVLLVLLLNAAGMTKAIAQRPYVIIGDLSYFLDDNTLTATVKGHKDGHNATGSLNIPSVVTYNSRTYTVTKIGIHAFYNYDGLTGSLNIPNSVIEIGTGAFSQCDGFTGNLTIGNSVTEIGNSAFYRCSGFTGNLTIGNSVTTIGGGAFQYCSGFTGGLIIPNSVTSIGAGAFDGCSGFTGNLTIPNSVTSIGASTFCNCSGLTGNLSIPNSVTSIGAGAFCNCSGFTGNLTIPNSVTSIGRSAFSGCSGFTGSLTIPNSVSTIPEYAFFECSGFTGNLTIGNSVTTIDNYAFDNCSGFTGSLTIPNSVTSIGAAFWNCSSLEQIVVDPDNANYDSRENCNAIIETSANKLVKGCKNTVIPNSVTEIGDGAFAECSGLTSIEIPNSVTSIGSFAFYNCSSLTSMRFFAETPPTIQSHTFYYVPESIPVYVPCGCGEAYQSAYQQFTNIQELCSQPQTITLSAGWNWFSANVGITLEQLQSALVEALPGTAITIKSRTQNTSYNPVTNQWRGTLSSLDVTQTYMIQTDTGCQITLSGMSINPGEHTITIHNGNNWIGFPLNESMSLSEAFAGFAIEGDVIKSRNSNATYTNGQWRGNLNTLEPGQGYMYYSEEEGDRMLTFPANTR